MKGKNSHNIFLYYDNPKKELISPIYSKVNEIITTTDHDKIYNINPIKEILSHHIYSINKIVEKDYFQNYTKQFQSIIQSRFSNAGVSIGLLDEHTLITAETLPQFVYPIVEYIREFGPDVIVASDRGARLVGLAVKLLYQKLYGRLPTYDGTLKFRKVSRKAPDTHNREVLSGVIEDTLKFGKNGRILFLDDWIASGGTQEMVSRLVAELGEGKIDLKYGVLVGGGGDISGKSQQRGYGYVGTVDWHDNAEKIGVDYDKDLQPFSVNSNESRNYRGRLVRGIDKFITTIKTPTNGKRWKKDNQNNKERELVFE